MFYRVVWLLAVLALSIQSIHAQHVNENDMKGKDVFQQMFPQGDENPPVNSQYFIGRSYLAQLTHNKELNCPVYNVTFEPGCRNNWHSHTGGQLLIVTAGRGYYQEKGHPARELLPGDVVEIAPNVVHWHGAAPDSWFAHLAVECNSQTNRNTWLEPVDDEQYAEATSSVAAACSLSGKARENMKTWQFGNIISAADMELAEVFGNFAFDETQRYGDLDMRTRIMVTMASAIASQGTVLYGTLVGAALDNGITPIEIREILYHAVPYVGMGKVADFIDVMNGEFVVRGIALPLDRQTVVSPDDRMETGLALQTSIFGDNIRQMYETSPADQLHIQKALSGNCFGDYQTRTGLDVRMRELLTFSMLISLGGCEPQVKGHIQGNINVGNDKAMMLAVVTQLLPYIGYPRTLNAVSCLNEVIPSDK